MFLLSLLKKQNWTNWGGNITVHPDNKKDTTQLSNQQLAEMVTMANSNGHRLKMVGSGHSFSDILDTTGTLLYRSAKKLPASDWIVKDVDASVLKNTPTDLVQIAGKATLNEVNKALKQRGVAFNNLGSAVLQTYAGALSTSTHGTGTTIPPLCDDVRSMLFVSPAYGLCRIEPTDGITDAVKYAALHPQITLLQNDDLFYATLVSMGCMGIVLEYITCVRACYKLEEKRTMLQWKELRTVLINNPGKYLDGRHFDIIINPYPDNNDYNCVITERRVVDNSTPTTKDTGKFVRWAVSLFQKSIGRFFKNYPFFIGMFLNISLKGLIKKLLMLTKAQRFLTSTLSIKCGQYQPNT